MNDATKYIGKETNSVIMFVSFENEKCMIANMNTAMPYAKYLLILLNSPKRPTLYVISSTNGPKITRTKKDRAGKDLTIGIIFSSLLLVGKTPLFSDLTIKE